MIFVGGCWGTPPRTGRLQRPGGQNKSSGGDGGKGGSGGKGGKGGGGGGHSFAVVHGPGATTTLKNAVLSAGTPGLGGAPNGLPGQAATVKQL